MSVLPECMSVYQVHPWCLKRAEESVGVPVGRFTDGCEWLCGSWELKPSTLEESSVILTAEPSAIVPLPLLVSLFVVFCFKKRFHYVALNSQEVTTI